MKKMKEKSKLTMPFRLPEAIKHLHQSYYLHYINNLCPEVSEELKKLNPLCVELFGKFPISLEKIQVNKEDFKEKKRKEEEKVKEDFIDSGVWYKGEAFNTGQDDGWQRFSETFGACICFENRSLCIREGVEEPLIIINPDAKGILEKEGKHLKIDLKLKKLIDFQNKFDSLLAKFHFGVRWLEKSVFFAIWNGTGKLQMSCSFLLDSSSKAKDFTEALYEIEKTLDPQKYAEFEKEQVLQYLYKIPALPVFTTPYEYRIDCSFNYYEEIAVEAYRQHLHQYFSVIKSCFRKHGYKLPGGDEYDYKTVQRLVYWNFSEVVYLWEIIQTIPEFKDVDMKKQTKSVEKSLDQEKEIKKATDKLRKSFGKFEYFDLPVRPWGELIR